MHRTSRRKKQHHRTVLLCDTYAIYYPPTIYTDFRRPICHILRSTVFLNMFSVHRGWWALGSPEHGGPKSDGTTNKHSSSSNRTEFLFKNFLSIQLQRKTPGVSILLLLLYVYNKISRAARADHGVSIDRGVFACACDTYVCAKNDDDDLLYIVPCLAFFAERF